MKPNVVLLNSGGSNYTSLQASFERLGVLCRASTGLKHINAASHLILPGVGSAGSAMQAIANNQLTDLIKSTQKPLLGICLGMQIMFETLDESSVSGLGLISGRISRLPDSDGIRVPHMGWNSVTSLTQHPIFSGLDGADFYFVHSYAAPISTNTIAQCMHGSLFSAAVARDNFIGVQFHPERSGPQGQTLLENFIRLSA